MRSHLSLVLKKALQLDFAPEITIPERHEFGHYATNVAMRIASEKKENPRAVAEALVARIKASEPELFARIEIAGPGFINFWVTSEAIRQEFAAVLKKEKTFGKSAIGKGKKVIVEYSQPNIAKQMHTGHLRTTIIGDALANVHAFLGYKVIRWNYLGDWGTQFGKLIVAYKKWGLKNEVEKNPITTLEGLYVRFHEAAKDDPSLEEEGRREFQKLEEGDRENRKLWKWFKEESLREVGEVYDLLKVSFDTYIGEAFFEENMKPLVSDMLSRGIAERSEGAVIVKLDEENLPPALIQKSDGASIYLTRDIAALEYRVKKYRPVKLLYVVGNEQTLHFSQLLAIAKRLGLGEKTSLRHVKYGLLLGEDGRKMSTRRGTGVLLKELIEKITAQAGAIIEKKNHSLSVSERARVARAVGVGALKYNDLRENRQSDITFDWKRMLDFSGDSAPYLQYTRARLLSIIKKAGRRGKGDIEELSGELDLALMRKLFEFPEEVERSAEILYTNNIAQYLYGLAVLANRFYESTPILKDENRKRRDARLALIGIVAVVIERGLSLFGIESPDNI